jgi:hypothetical protein
MKDEMDIGQAFSNNVISQNQAADKMTVDVYDSYGKKLIEGVMPANSVHALESISITSKEK